MEIFVESFSVETVRNKLLGYEVEELPETNKELWELYNLFLHLRHDTLHLFVCDALDIKFEKEKRIFNIFKNIPITPLFDKSPDIVLEFENEIIMIDVSINVDICKAIKIKEEKYLPICKELPKYTSKETKFIHFSLLPGYGNINIQLMKVNKYLKKDFDISNFGEMMSHIRIVLERVLKKIDKEYLEIMIQELSNTKTTDSIFLEDDVRYRVVSEYKEMDIDINSYEKFFEKNDKNLKNIFHQGDLNYNEEKLVVDLREILEDIDGFGLNFLKDNELCEADFGNAYIDIVTDLNSRRQMKHPKPTHHIMFDMDFKNYVRGTNEKINDQQDFLEFMRDFLINRKEVIHKDNKFKLVENIFNITAKTVYNPKGNFDKRLFVEGLDSVAIEVSGDKLIKEKLKLLRCFKNNLKVTQSLCVSLNIDSKQWKNDGKYREAVIKGLGLSKDLFEKDCPSLRDYIKGLYRGKFKPKNKKEKTRSYVIGKSTINVGAFDLNPETREELKKNGVKVDRSSKDFVKEGKFETLNFGSEGVIDDFLTWCEEDSGFDIETTREFAFMNSKPGSDSEEAYRMKEEMVNQYMVPFKKLSETNCYFYSRQYQIIAKELFHQTQFKYKDNTFTFLNGGSRNTIIIVANCYITEQRQIGKPFMCIVKTRYPENYTTLYGQIYKYKIENSEYWYIFTNWRRLSLNKLVHLSDTHYSVLSSTMNSCLSNPKPQKFIQQKMNRVYSIRTLIAHSTSQKIGEFLMDNRYAYMSTFSEYTNIKKLLVEKFSPPYFNDLQLWFIKRIFKKLPMIFKESKDNNSVILSEIRMLNNKRDPSYIGGKIKVSSLWGEYFIEDVTELLDEIFIYVHTMKEPSNIYHEAVKALKTIIKFQSEFDNLDTRFRTGDIKSKVDILDFLKGRSQIGFSKPIIMNSVNFTLHCEKPNFRKIISEVNDESICELISTKAVIADVERHVEISKQEKSKSIQKKDDKKKQDFEKLGEEINVGLQNLNFIANTIYYRSDRPRQKVFETILDTITQDQNIKKTIHLANHHITKTNGKVVADICIKSQYGSKREFYVINIEAKASARITELFFRKLSENSPNEAISVPGERKILKMQDMVDRVFTNFERRTQRAIFINGDCTKWSAAETMGSFLSVVEALKEKISYSCFLQLKSTFLAWGMKKIQIPLDIVKNTYPTKTYDTMFLKDYNKDKDYMIDSTQNFLQGMFNYASSYKAVCCKNYLYHIWKKIYPSSKIIYEHLEHSDDYVGVLIYNTREEIMKFRVLEKIMMKLHGYNDSDRKTSCQPYFMEFVSLISFNGVMLYPQIKKSKECNLNLPCIGYKQDTDAALSRVKECSRVGCNQTFLYFFQRMHLYLISTTYSLLPGMCNNSNKNLESLLNTPVELFGIPDPLPLFSLYCKGNINNYRIMRYSGEQFKKMIYYLYLKTCIYNKDSGSSLELEQNGFSLHTPRCVYSVNTKTIKKIRKSLGISTEEVLKFWEENITYHLCKPKDISKLTMWLKCMFYNRTFIEAYVKQSRVSMAMRLSKIVKNKCFKDLDDIRSLEGNISEYMKNTYTLMEYREKYFNDIEKNTLEDLQKICKEVDDLLIGNLLEKILTNSDATVSCIYSILDQLWIETTGTQTFKEGTIQVAKQTPHKLISTEITNDPAIILQYIFNYNNFLVDHRKIKSPESLMEDINKIQKNVLIKKNSLLNQGVVRINSAELLAAFNDISLTKSKRIVTFGFTRLDLPIDDTILEILRYNFLPGVIMRVGLKGTLIARDPFTKNILYTKGKKLTIDYTRQCLENSLLLYMFFCIHLDKNIEEFKIFMTSILFKFMDKTTIDENVYDNIYSILSSMSLTTFKQLNYNMNEKKIAAFMKFILFNETDLMSDIVQSNYVFNYRYVITSELLPSKLYKGYTEVDCSYLGFEFKICFDDNICEYPIVVINNSDIDYPIEIYNIALRLCQRLSAEQLELTMNKNRIEKIPFDCYKKILSRGFYSENYWVPIEIQSGFKYKLIKYLVKTYERLNEKAMVYPFIYADTTFRKHQTRKMNVKECVFSIDHHSLCVKSNNKKMFTIPYWECEQFDNMLWLGDEQYCGLNMKSLLKNKVIKRFLFGESIKDYYEPITKGLDVQKMILSEICLNKNYCTKLDELKTFYLKNCEYNAIPDYVMDSIFCEKREKKIKNNNMKFVDTNFSEHFKKMKSDYLMNKPKITEYIAIDKSKSYLENKRDHVIKSFKIYQDSLNDLDSKDVITISGKKFHILSILLNRQIKTMTIHKFCRLYYETTNFGNDYKWSMERFLKYDYFDIKLFLEECVYRTSDRKKVILREYLKDVDEKFKDIGLTVEEILFFLSYYMYKRVPEKNKEKIEKWEKEQEEFWDTVNTTSIMDMFKETTEFRMSDYNSRLESKMPLQLGKNEIGNLIIDNTNVKFEDVNVNEFLEEDCKEDTETLNPVPINKDETVKSEFKKGVWSNINYIISAGDFFVEPENYKEFDKVIERMNEKEMEKYELSYKNEQLYRMYKLPNINFKCYLETIRGCKIRMNFYELCKRMYTTLTVINYNYLLGFNEETVRDEFLYIYYLLCNCYIINNSIFGDEKMQYKYLYDGKNFINYCYWEMNPNQPDNFVQIGEFLNNDKCFLQRIQISKKNILYKMFKEVDFEHNFERFMNKFNVLKIEGDTSLISDRINIKHEEYRECIQSLLRKMQSFEEIYCMIKKYLEGGEVITNVLDLKKIHDMQFGMDNFDMGNILPNVKDEDLFILEEDYDDFDF